MGTVQSQGVRKFFFGSLADAMIQGLRKTLFIVSAPEAGEGGIGGRRGREE
jgi:nucleotide-binding universal stress UspA family protein